MPFGATPSRWCVCQFHHFRTFQTCWDQCLARRTTRGLGYDSITVNLREHFRTTSGALGRWIVAQAQDSFAVGLLWLVGLWIIRVPLAPLCAVLGALFQIVPHFGPILGLIGPVLAA